MPATEFIASQYSKIFWFESLKRPREEQSRYHVYGLYHYAIHPDLNRLNDALQGVVNNHYNLRSNFIERNGDLIQVIHDNVIVTLEFLVANTDIDYQNLLEEITSRPFDLANEPLFRFTCIENKVN